MIETVSGSPDPETTDKGEITKLSICTELIKKVLVSLLLAWDGGGSSFDRSLERETPDKKTEPTPERKTTERLKAWVEMIRLKVTGPPPTPAPALEPMRLTRNELATIQMVMSLELPWLLSSEIIIELCDWYLLGDKYPFREYDEDFVSLSLGAMNAKLPPKKKPEGEKR